MPQLTSRLGRGLRVCLLLSLLLAPVLTVTASDAPVVTGPTGKIAGRVLDGATGEPLPGANVAIVGTTQGTAADVDGYYYILNVKPGTYSVRASLIGFAAVTVEEVKVIPDKTTTVDFSLSEEILEGEEIIITAERPIVQVDRTTTTSVVDAEQISALPVTNIGEIVNLQAGVVDGHFRGGRTGEVSYLVNGVPITNAFSSDPSFEIESNMVSSLEVISGVFNAEYGQATSGVINVITKDVPSEWSGSFLGYVGAIASDKKLEFVRRDVAAGSGLSADDFSTEFVSYLDAAEFPNLMDFQANLGGPVIRDRLGIKGSVRYLNDKSHFIARDLFSPADSSFTSRTNSAGLPVTTLGITNPDERDGWLLESTGSGDFVSANSTERISVNGTVNLAISNRLKLDYNVFIQDGEFTPYSHSRKYVPRGVNTTKFFNQTHIAGLTFTVGNNAFGNLSYSYLRDLTDVSLYDSPTDLRYASGELNSLQGANAFSVAGNDLFTVDQKTVTHTIVADYSQQLNRVHLAKVGVQARLHTLDNFGFGIERSFRTGNLPQASPDPFADNLLKANPKEFSAYVQDKMEFTGLIVNAGLRFDYFEPDYLIPRDWSQAEAAEIPDPANPSTMISNRRSADTEMQLSPRLGIAFPISATGVMRFSAGLFFQIPQLSLLYTNPEYEINPQSSANTFGNAGISPERTLAFEVGLQQGLTETLGTEVTIFAKDVRNLTGQEILRNPNGDFAIRWINRDYGTIRGLTLSMFQRGGGTLDWTLDYTLQFAEGTSSSPGEAFGRQQAGLDEILSLVRLDWDRRHVVNNTLTLKPFTGFSLTVINTLQSGAPYTTVRDFVRSNVKNNAVRPLVYSTDLRAYYAPPIGDRKLQVFAQVQNLTDSERQFGVYENTGLADESVDLELLRRTDFQVGGVNSLDEFFFRQEFFGAPRKVSIGLSYSF